MPGLTTLKYSRMIGLNLSLSSSDPRMTMARSLFRSQINARTWTAIKIDKTSEQRMKLSIGELKSKIGSNKLNSIESLAGIRTRINE
jgi:hypothetical protein